MSNSTFVSCVNRGTATMAVQVSPWEVLARAEATYAAVRELLESVRPIRPGGSLVAHLEGSRLVWRSLGADPESFLVLGRHERCDLRLTDPVVSLRHVLVRPSPGGAPDELEVIGLRNRGDLEILGAGPVGRATVRGPAALLLAGHPVVVVPSSAALPDRLPAPEVIRVTSSSGGSAPSGERGEMGTLRTLHELPQTAVVEGDAVLTLVTSDADESFRPSARALEEGIVFGRDARCDLRGGGVGTELEVSRVHALLVKDGERVRVYDTASSNGVHALRDDQSVSVRFIELDPNRPTSFSLGHVAAVVWTPGALA